MTAEHPTTNGSYTRQRSSNGRPVDEEAEIGSINEHHNSDEVLSEKQQQHRGGVPDRAGLYLFAARFMRRGKKKIGVVESLHAIAFSSWLNILLVLIPIAWVSNFKHWSHTTTFVLSFLAIIPLERLFDYGGEQMAYYCGKDLGDLIVITLNNAVEATLAIILLERCELKLLQSTIIGVVILHLLLIPGTSFLTGGARIMHQDLHPHLTELNHTMLTIGVLSLLIPAAFFAALDRGITPGAQVAEGIVNEEMRHTFLVMSRGLALILLMIYICSRIFLHNPPGDGNALRPDAGAPAAVKHEEAHLEDTDPEVNQWVCIVMILICIGLMGATAEWLVESIEFVRESGRIQEEWFGLVLLPIVSFAADGTVAIVFFIRSLVRHFFHQPAPPATLAKARAIDLSIQFTLFWMPFFVLLGWWTNRPLILLFDFFEVAILIGACFVVNYVTADAKTNWAEGFAMIAFYVMIALCAWFYTGQPEIEFMLACRETVAEAIAAATGGGHAE
ncbi:hypothetical protein BDQ12DRAFT_674681 [Crucibulum laeve]|uniref:Sodium/calcium exchanger membrane region domain-containing protein n=1 Tax=Crucibulum laeve TaxID=68775 RepID=A0A5C3MH57_9AGAR|nr:hypothetical protein BDQ12DRAFT_674681 [Crucibulum laeve]